LAIVYVLKKPLNFYPLKNSEKIQILYGCNFKG